MFILVCGKAGAGKTHYARTIAKEFREIGKKVCVIDGDEFRRVTGNDDFSDTGRHRNLMAAANIAANMERKGFAVIMSFICPRREWRVEIFRKMMDPYAVYLPGGNLWPGTTFDFPFEKGEIDI